MVSRFPLGGWGHFVGAVKPEWHDDGRTMTRLDDFGCADESATLGPRKKGKPLTVHPFHLFSGPSLVELLRGSIETCGVRAQAE